MSLPIPPHPHFQLRYKKRRYTFSAVKAKQMIGKIGPCFKKAMPMANQKTQSSMSPSQFTLVRSPIVFRTVIAMLAKKHKIPIRNVTLLSLVCSFQLIAIPPKPFLGRLCLKPMRLSISPHLYRENILSRGLRIVNGRYFVETETYLIRWVIN